jgi:xanthine dehydrogenase/oxidase
VGASEVSIELKFRAAGYRHLIAATHVPELNALGLEAGGLRVGASVTLTRLLEALRSAAAADPSTGAVFAAAAAQLRWFAGAQIRNVASLGGNIVTGASRGGGRGGGGGLRPLSLARSLHTRLLTAVHGPPSSHAPP